MTSQGLATWPFFKAYTVARFGKKYIAYKYIFFINQDVCLEKYPQRDQMTRPYDNILFAMLGLYHHSKIVLVGNPIANSCLQGLLGKDLKTPGNYCTIYPFCKVEKRKINKGILRWATKGNPVISANGYQAKICNWNCNYHNLQAALYTQASLPGLSFFGCLGAVYFKDSFPPVKDALSWPNRLASLEEL